MKEMLKKHAYPCCLVWLLCVGIVTTLNAYLEFNINEIFISLLLLTLVVLVHLFDYNRKNIIPYIILLFLIIIIAVVLYSTGFSFETESQKYWKWLLNAIYDGPGKQVWYSIFTAVILSLSLVIIMSILLKRFYIRIAMAILFFVFMILACLGQLLVSKLGICCFLTYSFLMFVETKLFIVYKKENKDVNATPFLLPFFLIFISALMILPMQQKPIEWKLVKEAIHKISSTIDNIFDDIELWKHPEKGEFSLSFTGYSEGGDVGGTLDEGSGEALKVTTSTTYKTNIYLMGNVKNTYDGTKWSYDVEENEEDSMNEYMYDVSEFKYAVHRTGGIYEEGALYKMDHMNLKYLDLYTHSIFYPLKSTMIELSDDADTKCANLNFDDTMGEGTTYFLNYVQMNQASDSFINLIHDSEQYQYEDTPSSESKAFANEAALDSALKDYSIPENFEQLLCHRANEIKMNYTDVYDSLPQRVRDLAVDITKDCTTDYDKLIALEEYFETFTYTTSPKNPGPGEDLIDFMIFDSKEGYCTYYATAFAIMARCLGIPTRYVQGFCISTNQKKIQYEYIAFNRDAHAWVEAYIEGIGWIPFEPTPTFVSPRNMTWDYVGTETKPFDTAAYKQQVEKQEQEELLRQEELHNMRKAYQSVVFVLILVIFTMLVSIPVYFIIRYRILRKRYERSSIDKKIFYDIKQMLYTFGVCVRNRENSETFSQYMCCIREQYPKQDELLVRMEQVFHQIRYNDEIPTEEQQKAIQKLRLEVLHEAKLRLTKKQYIKLRWNLFSNRISI